VTAGSPSESDALDRYARPVVPEAFTTIRAASLGAWIVRMFAARVGVPIGQRLEPAAATLADVFSVQFDPVADAFVAAWHTRLSDGSATSIWPQRLPKAVERWPDAPNHEIYMVASDPALPDHGRGLAWEAVPKRSDADDSASAAAAISLLHSQAIGCALHHLRW